MNGFLFEFKEKCDTNFINNFKLIDKDEADEFQIFNYSQLHYRNLERLLLQGRATLQRKLINYSFDNLMEIKKIKKMKIESITRYFIENFQKLKDKRNKELKELGKATGENDKEERAANRSLQRQSCQYRYAAPDGLFRLAACCGQQKRRNGILRKPWTGTGRSGA